MTYSLKGKKVWVAGHRGMVGSAIVRRLAREECKLLTVNELDMRRGLTVEGFMQFECPDLVFVAAARVGGIGYNIAHPVDMLRDNLLIAQSTLHAAHVAGVERLIYLGSSCMYPREAPQPMHEGYLGTGPLEPTNAPYALAKLAALELCQAYRKQHGRDFVFAISSNVYGPGDDFDPERGHFIGALLGKIMHALPHGVVQLWGDGGARREFLYVDDLADALIYIAKHYNGNGGPVNVGIGADISIREVAEIATRVTEFRGRIEWDSRQPNGAPRKLLDMARLDAIGWRPAVTLPDGLRLTWPHASAIRLRRNWGAP